MKVTRYWTGPGDELSNTVSTMALYHLPSSLLLLLFSHYLYAHHREPLNDPGAADKGSVKHGWWICFSSWIRIKGRDWSPMQWVSSSFTTALCGFPWRPWICSGCGEYAVHDVFGSVHPLSGFCVVAHTRVPRIHIELSREWCALPHWGRRVPCPRRRVALVWCGIDSS